MRGRRRQRARTLLLIAVGLVVTCAALAAYTTDSFRRIDLDTVDARFSIRGEQKPPAELALVEIDDVTFDQLRQRWPFPRHYHARVIDELKRAGAKAIAYDVQFTEPSADPREDLALYRAAGRAGNVVFGTTEVARNGETNILGGNANLERIDAHPANSLLPNDPGGVIRRVNHSTDGLDSLAVVTAGVAGYEKPHFDDASAWIDYAGPPGTIPAVSFSRVFEGRADPDLFRNKVVVVGPSAPSLQDVHPTSTTGASDLMPGAEIQANAIDTVARALPLKPVAGWIDIALIVALGMFAPIASIRLAPLRALTAAAGLGAMVLVAAQFAFDSGWIFAVVYPIGALVLGSVGALGVHYFTETRERRRLRMLFGRFVPETVVDEVVDRTDDDLRLGGVELQCTVLFSDLRGFTTFSEVQSADRVIDILNGYFEEMSEAILDNGGTLLGYLGDGIIAVFGAPIEQPNHADRAVAAAREMIGERLERFNQGLQHQGLDGFRMGVGLNSGAVMCGNVGSARRLEYTAIGDTVNTASRIESMTKGTPHQLFVADSTRSMMRDPDGLVFVDEFEVRGRREPVKLWSLAQDVPNAPTTQASLDYAPPR
ncbi:MAG: adenylate/guanylate cyclase domain-containing protein [Solirubrobacterales bacterium]